MRYPPFAERAGEAADEALCVMRRAIEQAVASGVLTTSPPALPSIIGQVRCLSFVPDVRPRATVVHFHGGGYRIGAPELTARYARAIADACTVEVVCPAYRLAPEFPFPAAVNDGWRVWQALAERRDRPLLLAGDSAGGGLAAGLVALNDDGALPVDGLILLSPWLDLSVSSACYDRNARTDPVFSREAATASAAQYLQGCPPRQTAISPLHASLAHFPPTLVSVGDGEVLADDGRLLHRRLATAGVTSCLSVIEAMEHVAVTRDLSATGAAETLGVVCSFIDQMIG